MTHPYRGAPSYQRWSAAMSRTPPDEIDPVISAPWQISATDAIATAGSCFAQHVALRLRDAGLRHLEIETAHPMLSPKTAEAFGYGPFSARYGSIYTARQLLQLLKRAYGRFTPADDAWEDSATGHLYDPFRPTIQPGGFPTRLEYELDRKRHFAAIREMFETLDVFIFTLGLTECWSAKADGAVYPLCPGVAAGKFDPDKHQFQNFGVREVADDLDAFLAELRAVNPKARVILTVSPVPLAATAEPRHVWVSTTLSKAVLRLAAEEIAQRWGAVYFPSYEIITSPAARGNYFEPDLRSISAMGVDHVMRIFFTHMVGVNTDHPLPRSAPAPDFSLRQAQLAIDVLCDESRLDTAEVFGLE